VTRQAVYVQRNIEARSCSYTRICSGNVRITYCECFVALVIQHAMRLRLIVVCGLAHS
jgi:hypothetical protein